MHACMGMAMDSHAVASICMAQFSFPNESPCVFAFIGDMKSVVGERMPSHGLNKVIGPVGIYAA